MGEKTLVKKALFSHAIPSMKRKRLNFTLLEVLIALALAGALFTALFSYFRQSTENNIKAQQLKRTILPLELLNQRLTQIFANLSKADFQTLTSPDALEMPSILNLIMG